jgi:hypothetical protein
MADTSRERYAVVSCHVERLLDDDLWARFSKLQLERPSGFAIAALLRSADEGVGENEERWLERAWEAAARGPLGHHTHWTAPDHARPVSSGTGERVLEEGRRLRELGITPATFCGGGWYTDVEVAEACAELGYVDCTPRASRPAYLPADAAWASLRAPARIVLPSGSRLLGLPTTHSLGDLARALLHRDGLPRFVHVYFHDTDLVDRRRRALLRVGLALLARRARPTDLDLAPRLLGQVPEIAWNDVARP